MLPDVTAVRTLETIRQTLASREVPALTTGPSGDKGETAPFGDALNRLTEPQAESEQAIERLIAGEQVDLHQVMLSVEKTDLAFRVALQLRNQLVQAYQEIMRMQV